MSSRRSRKAVDVDPHVVDARPEMVPLQTRFGTFSGAWCGACSDWSGEVIDGDRQSGVRLEDRVQAPAAKRQRSSHDSRTARTCALSRTAARRWRPG